MIIEIDNPCYHCYTGDIGECRTIGCKYINYPWSEDLEADYKVDYDMKDEEITDEELAEEYVSKNNIEWELECYRTSPIGEVIQAFLSGLKAGRPQWHDLRENPNDLPKEKCDVLDENGNTLHYDSGYFYKEYIFCTKEYPIAWCEIPTFDKE